MDVNSFDLRDAFDSSGMFIERRFHSPSATLMLERKQCAVEPPFAGGNHVAGHGKVRCWFPGLAFDRSDLRRMNKPRDPHI